jgi:hypothetical protein
MSFVVPVIATLRESKERTARNVVKNLGVTWNPLLNSQHLPISRQNSWSDVIGKKLGQSCNQPIIVMDIDLTRPNA